MILVVPKALKPDLLINTKKEGVSFTIPWGSADIGLYKEMIGHLNSYGEVLTEHIGHTGISPMGEVGLTDQEIYNRDMDWLSSSDVVVADVSTPSLGVGFEIASAIRQGKSVLCIYRIQEERRLSAMISGCPDIQVKEYTKLNEAKQIMDDFFR